MLLELSVRLRSESAGLSRRKRVKLVCMAALTTSVACSDGGGPSGPPPPSPSPNPGVVASEPVVLPAGALSLAWSRGGTMRPGTAAMARATVGGMSYVYFKPGTFSDEADEALIENLTTPSSRTARVVQGGIDPVPIAAEVEDSLEVSVYDRDVGGGLLLSRVRIGVPVARMPEVVRAEPARGRTAVPINRNVTIVFSEPVEPTTITPESIQLREAGQPVSAVLELQADGFTVVLRPAAWLQPDSEYEIVVSADVRDLAGEPLASPFVSHFTTGSTSSEIYVRRLFDYGQLMGIWVVNPDGTGLREIVRSEKFFFWDLDVSPDGRRIAFSGGYDDPDNPLGGFHGNKDIWVMDSGGLNWVRLTDHDGWDDGPIWSPDGTKIAFSSERGEDWSDIYVMDAESGGLVDAGRGWAEDWSPDGSKILFADWDADTLPDGSLWSMNANGTGRTLLVEDAVDGAWSPDGTRIAFIRKTGGFTCISNPDEGFGPEQYDVFLMNPDGSDVIRITDTRKLKSDLAWSPDGERLAYSEQYSGSYTCGAGLIAVMNADGSGRFGVTGADGGADGYLSWR